MHDEFHLSPAYLNLQPLRIPAGWAIHWNTLYASSSVEAGDFGGSSTFTATNSGRRFHLDIAFKPEHDPRGEFHLVVLYQPWPRTDRGKRRQDLPLIFDDDSETVHASTTRSYSELVSRLEEWIARCSVWVREGH
jgi:hypothetical protein